MLRFVHTLVAAFVLSIAALVAAAPAQAQVAGGVGYRVAQEAGSQLEAGYLTLTVNAGQTSSGFFFMTNTAKPTAQMRIYSADGLTGNTTGVVYGSAGDPLAEAGSWLTPSIRSAVLTGESERRIDFSVRVPPGASAGDHVGSIVLEQNGKTSATVSQVVRNVVPIRIVVPGAPGPQIVVRSAKIDGLPGTTLPAVIVGLRNTGPRLCAPILSVSLRGPSEKGREVSRQLDTILPGDRVPYPLPWPRTIEPGSYVARVTSSGCGTTESITVEVQAPDLSVSGAGAGGGSTPGPSVVTDAQPGDSIYRAGDGKPSGGAGKGSGNGKGKGNERQERGARGG
ncbi:MAG: hypothetical protein Q7T55_09105, partial [Solirubrobacteraceae bacterium]|nr:hypothetical protein [Solirubrobacteraceae bacterium]